MSGILFDLDGTLADTMGAFADVAARVLARYGLAADAARARYRETSGVPFRRQLDAIVPGAPAAELDDAAADFEREKQAIAASARMDAPTESALRTLRAAGHRLGISSNGAQVHVDAFAARTPGLFELALGWASGHEKPHAIHARRALGEPIVFVGDSPQDRALAEAAGFRFVAKVGTFPADAWRGVPTFDDYFLSQPLLAR
jgi:phosphoglycolate phosphatase-like HAD superfamily hydrolase